MNIIFMISQAFLLVFALGIDAFVCSFSYGANKIKIPIKSVLLINAITVTLLAFGSFTSRIIGQFLPQVLIEWLPFLILTGLGLSKIFEGTIKQIIKKHNGINKDFEFSLFNLGFILQVYADNEIADSDHSKILSMKEAIPLAIALGLDGLSVGFSAGLTSINIYLLLAMSLTMEFICITVASKLGSTVAKKTTLDLSIFSGLILILIAISDIL